MPYAVIGDVQGMMAQFTISATTKPTTTQAEAIIEDISYEVDTHLAAAGVTVPVTAPDYFLAWLGRVTGYGSVAAILKSMFPAASGAGETPAYAFWEARYRAALKGIDDGTLLPAGVTSTDRIGPSTYLTRFPEEEYDLGVNAEPFFKRRQVW